MAEDMAAKARPRTIGRKLYLAALGMATGWLLLVIAMWASQLHDLAPGHLGDFTIRVLGIGMAPLMAMLLLNRWFRRRRKP